MAGAGAEGNLACIIRTGTLGQQPPGRSDDGAEILSAVQTAEYTSTATHSTHQIRVTAVVCLAVSPAGETVALWTNPARVLG